MSNPSSPPQFDPARDGFTNARLLWVLAHFAEKLSKETALLSYGAWNPLFCEADASARAVALFAELSQYVDHYAAQAAIALETSAAESPLPPAPASQGGENDER